MKMIIYRIRVTLLALLLLLFSTAIVVVSAQQQETNTTNTTTAFDTTIYGVIGRELDLVTLEAALIEADLTSLLEDVTKNFTMFAPTDDAFSTLDPKYLTENWRPHLILLLRFHATNVIINSSVISTNTAPPLNISTLVGSEDPIQARVLENGTIAISGPAFNDTCVVQADLNAANGVLHKVNHYFWPVALTLTLLDLAQVAPGFDQVAQLLVTSGMEQELAAPNRTIFAPSNSAFNALPAGYYDAVAADPAKVRALLSYHMLDGVYPSSMLTNGTQLTTMLAGQNLTFTVKGGGKFATRTINNNATITVVDGVAANGLGYLIDQVLIPPETNNNQTDTPPTSPTAPVAAPTAPVASPTAPAAAPTAPVAAPTSTKPFVSQIKTSVQAAKDAFLKFIST